MKITCVRWICQLFFLLLFFWFCIVASVGEAWWQLRGWPVNWLLQLDPLHALGVLFSTGALNPGLIWAMATIVLTILLGRFFCGWVCPFGTLHQALGWLGERGATRRGRRRRRLPHPAQGIKYYLLAVLLVAAIGGWLSSGAQALGDQVRLVHFFRHVFSATLQTGWLDPLSLMHRSINLVLLPWLGRAARIVWASPRVHPGALWIAWIFFSSLAINFWRPRFYCRYVCPLGALLGILGRFSLWRVGKKSLTCSDCLDCNTGCEGACDPAGRIQTHECVLCMKCLWACPEQVMAYRTARSAGGEIAAPNLTRRGLITAVGAGLATPPILRLGTGLNGYADRIRPPGARAETELLARCIKCGQCMRVCPTNIVQPALLEAGWEGIWTPVLNFRMGGCALPCVACGQICPTGALRPLSVDEKLGRNRFAETGPIRIGTAFVDLGRCLPWAMDRPCIVCQENCPVSPKAIFVREVYNPVRNPLPPLIGADPLTVRFGAPVLPAGRFATGDFYCRVEGKSGPRPRRIVEHGMDFLAIDPNDPWDPPPRPGDGTEVLVRLQRPVVDPEHCIGCGMCEHVCPLSGVKAIRVHAENESRHVGRSFLL